MAVGSGKIVTLIAYLACGVLLTGVTTALPQDVRSPSLLPDVKSEKTPPADLNLGSDYVIGAQDVLDIEVFDYPELTKTVRVSSNGAVSLPLVGQVRAEGLTTEQLQKEVESMYSQTYLEKPKVTVSVREFHARPVSVIGEVGKPGLYQVTGPNTLVEMLSQAGGLTKVAGRTVLVTRPGGFGSLEQVEGMRQVGPDQVEINLQRLLYSHDQALNIEVKPQDSIAVNKADVIYVVGAVRKAAGFTLEGQEKVTVLEALAMAGGLDVGASKRGARIIRLRSDGTRVEIPVNIGKILNGKSQDVEMAVNDILFVPSSTGKNVAKRGAEGTVGVLTGLLIYGRL